MDLPPAPPSPCIRPNTWWIAKSLSSCEDEKLPAAETNLYGMEAKIRRTIDSAPFGYHLHARAAHKLLRGLCHHGVKLQRQARWWFDKSGNHEERLSDKEQSSQHNTTILSHTLTDDNS